MSNPWHYHLMACLYVLAGLAHWKFPRAYLKVLPPWVPWKDRVVWASGLLEIAVGTALWLYAARVAALWAIMGMLVLFIPVHVHMLTDPRAGLGLPRWLLWLRLFLQGLLIYWASCYLP